MPWESKPENLEPEQQPAPKLNHAIPFSFLSPVCVRSVPDSFASKSAYKNMYRGPGLHLSVYYDFQKPSTIAFMNSEDHAEDPRFVAHRQHGKALRDIHLRLNELLRGGVDVGGVSNLDIPGDILLHRNSGARTADGSHVGGIDLNAAPAE